jgi:hypothetical protein
MCRLLIGVLLLVPAVVLAADPPADGKSDAKSVLKPGADLPGVFLPYNVTGPYKGRFHSLISDYGPEPVVVIFARDLEASPAVKDLLQQLDQRIEKNPVSRLHAFAVFVSDDLPDVLTNDDKREELAKKLEDQAVGLGLKNVVVSLDSPKDVEKYALGDARTTVLLYNKFRVVTAHTLPPGAEQAEAAKAEVGKIMAEVGEKLKAAKTK